MGKYMKKTKSAVAMELSSHSSSTAAAAETSGVRTRAKTLALQKLQRSPSPPPKKIVPVPADDSSFSYLQLRSRRLEKPPLRKEDADEISGSGKGLKCKAPSSRLVRVSSEAKSSVGKAAREGNLFGSAGEGSFGENYCSEFEPRESRSTRESTPCSLIRRSDDSVGTPGSTTRQGASMASNRRVSNETNLRNFFPTVQEMDDFFACEEERQQRLFTEKYNFDVVNDSPLPGRYEWVQVTR
ncbi:Cyclin-dependent kinase inhibitor 3 [Linum perenne]